MLIRQQDLIISVVLGTLVRERRESSGLPMAYRVPAAEHRRALSGNTSTNPKATRASESL
jgi:hypothetical protein